MATTYPSQGKSLDLEHKKTTVTLQTVSDKTTRQTCRMIITDIRQFLVKRLKVELRVFGIVEAGDDIVVGDNGGLCGVLDIPALGGAVLGLVRGALK